VALQGASRGDETALTFFLHLVAAI
jgi:hypothetical protein